MSTADRSQSNYHHGNLREALLQAAIDSIRTDGVDHLSLRALARSVGVSQTAPYRHFADKNTLLAELAADAFAELASTTAACIRPEHSASDNMQQSGEAYLRYALHNPEKYRLMFGTAISNREQYPNLVDTGTRAFGILLRLIEQGVASGEFIQQPPLLLANACWSNIHGFALLSIDGIFARRPLPASPDVMLQTQVQLTLRSLQQVPAALSPALSAAPSAAPSDP